MHFKPIHLFSLLCICFLVYSVCIYLIPYKAQTNSYLAHQTAQGKLVWQKYNCQSCHQVYGLGGYLGPDLTNVYHLKGVAVIKGMVANGGMSMPAFSLSQQEQDDLLMFLKAVSLSGNGDYKSYQTTSSGMIKLP